MRPTDSGAAASVSIITETSVRWSDSDAVNDSRRVKMGILGLQFNKTQECYAKNVNQYVWEAN